MSDIACPILPKIYLYIEVDIFPEEVRGCATAESGHLLWHYSYASAEIAAKSLERNRAYGAHYPEGFELVREQPPEEVRDRAAAICKAECARLEEQARHRIDLLRADRGQRDSDSSVADPEIQDFLDKWGRPVVAWDQEEE